MSRPLTKVSDFPSSNIDVRTVTDIRDGVTSVTDESCVIPSESPYMLYLDYIPKARPEFWTGAGKTGIQFTTIEAGTPSAGQVLESQGRLTFASDDAGGTLYASYTGVAARLEVEDVNYLQDEVLTTQEYVAALPTYTIGDMVCTEPTGIPAFSFVKIVDRNGSDVPQVQICKSTDVDYPVPMAIIKVAKNYGDTVPEGDIIPLGVVTGLTGMPNFGVPLYLGSDGLISWPGESNYPAVGQNIVVVGRAVRSTTAFIQIESRITTRT